MSINPDNNWWIDKMCDTPEFINEYMNEYVGNFDIGEKSKTSMLIMSKKIPKIMAQDIINVQPMLIYNKETKTIQSIEQEEFFKEEEFNL